MGGLAKKKVISVALGQDHSLAITEQGEIFSWGSNKFGQLGYNLPRANNRDDVSIQTTPRQIFNPFKKERSENLPNYPRKPNSQSVQGAVVQIPLPRRSLLIMHGESRYDWEHFILRENIRERRIVIAYRELTPFYLPGGNEENVGSEILAQASLFW